MNEILLNSLNKFIVIQESKNNSPDISIINQDNNLTKPKIVNNLSSILLTVNDLENIKRKYENTSNNTSPKKITRSIFNKTKLTKSSYFLKKKLH